MITAVALFLHTSLHLASLRTGVLVQIGYSPSYPGMVKGEARDALRESVRTEIGRQVEKSGDINAAPSSDLLSFETRFDPKRVPASGEWGALAKAAGIERIVFVEVLKIT